MLNKVCLIGNLGNDPEVRYTSSGGTPVANFRIATNEFFTDKNGAKQKRTEWHRITVWGKLAEVAGEHLTKGRLIYIEGRLQTRQWDDRDGVKRYTTEIHAATITFLPSGTGSKRTGDTAQDDQGPGAEEEYDASLQDDSEVPF